MADPKIKKATPINEEQLIQKEAELTAKENQLDSDIKEFEAFQERVHEIKESNDARDESFQKEKAAFDAQVAEFAQKKSEWENSTIQNLPVQEDDVVVELAFDGEIYEFAPGAPKLVNFGGQKFTQKEIAENEEIKLQLIGGNSSLIRKKK